MDTLILVYTYLLSYSTVKMFKYSRTKKTFSWFCKACSLGSCCLPVVNLLARTLFQAKLFHLTHKDIKKCRLAEIQVTYLAGMNWTNYITYTFHSRSLELFIQCHNHGCPRRSVYSTSMSISEGKKMEVIRGGIIISPDWVSQSRTLQSRTKTLTSRNLYLMPRPHSMTAWLLMLFSKTAYRVVHKIHGIVEKFLEMSGQDLP